jgi:hypothetical protein
VVQFVCESDDEFADGVIPKSRVFTTGTRNLAREETALVQTDPHIRKRVPTSDTRL